MIVDSEDKTTVVIWTIKDGRRLDRIIRQMESKIKNETNDELKLAYIDRIIKATHEKIQVANIVLGVRKILKEGKKKFG